MRQTMEKRGALLLRWMLIKVTTVVCTSRQLTQRRNRNAKETNAKYSTAGHVRPSLAAKTDGAQS